MNRDQERRLLELRQLNVEHFNLKNLHTGVETQVAASVISGFLTPEFEISVPDGLIETPKAEVKKQAKSKK